MDRSFTSCLLLMVACAACDVDFDASCNQDSDCVVVVTDDDEDALCSDQCVTCDGPIIAINRNELDRWRDDIEGVGCGLEPDACLSCAAALTTPTCQDMGDGKRVCTAL